MAQEQSLVAIFCVWADGLDLLPKAIKNILTVVDSVFVVWSETSNKGAKDARMYQFTRKEHHPRVTFIKWEPNLSKKPHDNERSKRNFGLDVAREYGATHFIMMDCDEFYKQDEFAVERDRIYRDKILGTVCRLRVYVGAPTLWCEDHTLVPFIHRIEPGMRYVENSKYPFTYDEFGHAHIDPTRRLSITSGVQMVGIYMHHYSYVRTEIDLKINNSSANLVRSREAIYRDIQNAKPGYKSELYHRELQECPNYFDL